MATTVRLPDQLQIEAIGYAQALGLSLNGIIAVALRDYLDQRKVARPPIPAELAQPKPERRARAPLDSGGSAFAVPANRRAPCPCGSGKRYSQCHGAKVSG